MKRSFDGKCKRQHVSLTIQQKVEILRKLDSGSTAKLLATEFGVAQRTVYDIKANKEKLLTYYAASDSKAGISERRSIRPVKSVNLDAVLFEWFKQRRSEGVPITGPFLREKAKELHAQLNVEEACNYSSGWLTSFKQRHGIRYLKACGEKLSADDDAAENFVDFFADYVKEEGLTPDQIYNADETGLFWRCLPRDTLVCADETNPSGFKEARERVTVLVCSNAAGTHQCELLVISKSKNPRPLKELIKKGKLPLIYKGNKKAWITRDLMSEWFENHFVKKARRHCTKIGLAEDCKILLVLDNCSAHPQGLQKDNVTVLFLPPNTTSLIQPMDQGIIRNLKSKYRVQFLRQMIAMNPSDLNQFKKNFTIKDCVFLLAESWDNLSTDTLVNAWHRLWPSSLFIDSDSSQNLNFDGFKTNALKEKSADLLMYAKATLNSVPSFLGEEDDVTEWLCEDEPAEIETVTDQEIIDSVVKQTDFDSEDTESDDEGVKITYEEGLRLGYKYLEFLQKQNCISEQEIMTVNRIQKKLIDNKPRLKQANLLSMFKKLNNA
jgi:hypothetical protein